MQSTYQAGYLALLQGGGGDLPELSSSLTVRHEARVGRHVVASRDIMVGETLAVEEATVWRLLPSPQLRKVCCHCMVESLTPLPCVKCAAVRYLLILSRAC